MVPLLNAKSAGSRQAGAWRLPGGSTWGPYNAARVDRGPYSAPRPQRPGAPAVPSTARPQSVTCSPAACGPNSSTKEVPRPQMAQEAAWLSRAQPWRGRGKRSPKEDCCRPAAEPQTSPSPSKVARDLIQRFVGRAGNCSPRPGSRIVTLNNQHAPTPSNAL